MENELPQCEKCGLKEFERINNEIETDLPDVGVILIKQEHYECRCGEIYLTEAQAWDFIKKLDENKFTKIDKNANINK